MYPDYTESFKYNLRYKIQKLIPKALIQYVIKYKYKKIFNVPLDLDNPLKLSEKIQWMKLNENSAFKAELSDKLLAKEFVSKNCPSLNYAKVYQKAKHFKDFDFSKLPNQFMFKTNHAWKTNVCILDKTELDNKWLKKLEKAYNKVLSMNYAYWSYYEMQYKNIKPKIYAEELLVQDIDYSILPEYEVYCFNSCPEFILYRTGGSSDSIEQSIYNLNWEKLNFNIEYGGCHKKNKPEFLNDLIYYSKILSKNLNFVRIDFFELHKKLYFGEMTFTPYSGFIKFIPDCFDLYYGKMLKL